MKETSIQKLIRELSEKYNISKFKVESIVMSEFHKVKETISDDKHESIQLMHLGKFQISEKRLNNFKNKKDEK